MKFITEKWIALTPYLQSILRIVAAFLFLIAGSIKLFAFPQGMPPSGDAAPLMSEAWIAGLIEFIGGSLLFLGLGTRIVALIASGEMAVAYFQVHIPQNIWPNLNGGMAAILFSFLWLYFSAAGPGAWSMDEMLKKPQVEEKPHPAFDEFKKAS